MNGEILVEEPGTCGGNRTESAGGCVFKKTGKLPSNMEANPPTLFSKVIFYLLVILERVYLNQSTSMFSVAVQQNRPERT